MFAFLLAALPLALAEIEVDPWWSWVDLQGEWLTDNDVPLNLSAGDVNPFPIHASGWGSMSFFAPASSVGWVGGGNATAYTAYVDGQEVDAAFIGGGSIAPTFDVTAPMAQLDHGRDGTEWPDTAGVCLDRRPGWPVRRGSTQLTPVHSPISTTSGLSIGCDPTGPSLRTRGRRHGSRSRTPRLGPRGVRSRPAELTPESSSGLDNVYAYTSKLGEAMTLRPPRGTKYVDAVSQTNGTTAGYTVTIRPDPTTGPATRTYGPNSYSVDRQPYLFMADLDPKQEYVITITNNGAGESGPGKLSFMYMSLLKYVPLWLR